MARSNRDVSQCMGCRLFMTFVNRPATNRSDSALLWGIAWLIITAIVGWYFRVMPTSSFGAITTGYVSLLNHVIINLVVWITACAIPFSLAVMLNRSTRAVELFGRMLFAHWPVVILMLPAVLGDKISYSVYMSSLSHMDMGVTFDYQPIYSFLMSLLIMFVLVWYLYWSYVAFKVTTRRGGIITFALLVGAMMLSWWLSDAVLDGMMGTIIK